MIATIILPSILTDSLDLAQKQLDLVQHRVERVQIDIIDGEFTDNVTIYPIDLKNLRVGNLKLDLHLMTNDPINDVAECVSVPNLHVIIAQIERMPSQQAFINHVKSYGWKVGLSLDLYTPESEVPDEILKQLDILQVMTVKTGYQDQTFQPLAVEKIRACDSRLQSLNHQACDLFADGAITPKTWKLCKEAGATHAAVGHYLWSSQNIAESLKSF